MSKLDKYDKISFTNLKLKSTAETCDEALERCRQLAAQELSNPLYYKEHADIRISTGPTLAESLNGLLVAFFRACKAQDYVFRPDKMVEIDRKANVIERFVNESLVESDMQFLAMHLERYYLFLVSVKDVKLTSKLDELHARVMPPESLSQGLCDEIAAGLIVEHARAQLCQASATRGKRSRPALYNPSVSATAAATADSPPQAIDYAPIRAQAQIDAAARHRRRQSRKLESHDPAPLKRMETAVTAAPAAALPSARRGGFPHGRNPLHVDRLAGRRVFQRVFNGHLE